MMKRGVFLINSPVTETGKAMRQRRPRTRPDESDTATIARLEAEIALLRKELRNVRKAADFWCWLLPLSLLSAILCLYGVTLQRSVPGGDSGELIVEAFQLGLPHPPGYPLYALLGHAFSHLPIGSIATRLNALSALCGGLAVISVYGAVLECCALLRGASELRIARPAAATASLLFGTSPLVWRYAVEAEVFALNNALVGTVVYLTLRWYRTRAESDARLGALLCGLALTNQHTAVLFIAPLIIMILHAGRDKYRNPRTLLVVAACFTLGLLPYAYLPLRSGLKGSWGDCRSLGGFLRHIIREEYGTFQLQPGDMDDDVGGVQRMRLYLCHLPGQMLVIGPFISLYGSIALLRARFRNDAPCALAVAFLCYFVVFNNLSNMDLSQAITEGVLRRFWMQPNYLVFVSFGVGAAELSAELVSAGKRLSIGVASYFVVLLLLGTCATVQVISNFGKCDRSSIDYLERSMRELLVGLPPSVLILSHGDHVTNALRYLQEAEGMRPDLPSFSDQLVRAPWFALQESLYEGIEFPSRKYDDNTYGFAWETLFKSNIDRGWNLFACGHTNINFYLTDTTQQNYLVLQKTESAFTSLYFGLCEWIVEKRGLPLFDTWWSFTEAVRTTSHELDYSAEISAHLPDTWEAALVRSKSTKHQKLLADIVFYAQRRKPHNVSILNYGVEVAQSFICSSPPFEWIQSSTWKNVAVVHLTQPDGRDNLLHASPGAAALGLFLAAKDAENDPQFSYMSDLHDSLLHNLNGRVSSDRLQQLKDGRALPYERCTPTPKTLK